MRKFLIMLAAGAALGLAPMFAEQAEAQQPDQQQMMQQRREMMQERHHPRRGAEDDNDRDRDHGRGAMGHGMMGQRGMAEHRTAGPIVMRMVFSLMDADGDGTLSLEEFKAAHERIYRGMDVNKDGRLTPEEMQAFMHGRR